MATKTDLLTEAPGRPAGAPPLSIVTVCKNIRREIADTCASLARQTWRGFEWLVVDGASSDGTLAELEKYRPHITLLISEPDRGIYHAMNKGIAKARGEYLLFLNGGDYLASPDTLEKVFSRRRTADILYGDLSHLYPDSGQLCFQSAPPSENVDKLFFVHDTIPHPAAFIRRDLFARFAPYDESFSMAADLEKWLFFIVNGASFEKLELPISIFRMNGKSNLPEYEKPLKLERKRIREKYFSSEELREARRRHLERGAYQRIFTWGGSRRLSLFAIDETRDGRKRKYRLFGLPVLKYRWRRGRRLAWLFGFIPLPWLGESLVSKGGKGRAERIEPT